MGITEPSSASEAPVLTCRGAYAEVGAQAQEKGEARQGCNGWKCNSCRCLCPAGVLRESELPQAVRWTDDTVDNENMNKKKSKSKHTCLNLMLYPGIGQHLPVSGLAWPFLHGCLY